MDLLKVEEVAALLRVPKSWIYMRTYEGASETIPHIKLGRHLRFRRAEIVAWVESLHRAGANLPVTN